jgi:hypothetical protein
VFVVDIADENNELERQKAMRKANNNNNYT